MPNRFDQPDAASFFKTSQRDTVSAEAKTGPLLEACKVDRLPSLKAASAAAYCVIDTPVKSKGDERREPLRKRTRLRSGKILDAQGKFLVECQVHDRSLRGAQLRLVSAMPLPRRIQFFDDEQSALIHARIIWRKKREIGIQFEKPMDAQAIKSGQRSALGGKYYAVP